MGIEIESDMTIKVDLFKQFNIENGLEVTRLQVQHNLKVVIYDFYEDKITFDELNKAFIDIIERLKE
jgi:predicted XRE-type DNA-binding protein